MINKVQHAWELDKSEPLRYQSDVSYARGGPEYIYVSGLRVVEFGRNARLSVIDSRGNVSPRHFIEVDMAHFVAFCHKVIQEFGTYEHDG